MKKFLLSIFFLILVITPSSVLADSSCWDVFAKQNAECAKKLNECVAVCAKIELNSRGNCAVLCEDAVNSCKSKVQAEYDACLRLSEQASEQSPQGVDRPYETKEITCEQVGEIMGSKDCPVFIAESWQVWCGQKVTDLAVIRAGHDPDLLTDVLPPNYTIKPDNDQQSFQSCISGGGTDEKKEENRMNVGQKKTGQEEVTSEDNIIGRFFGSNPFETWLNLRGLLELPQALSGSMTTTEILLLEGTGHNNWVKNKYGDIWDKGNQVKTEIDPKAVLKFADLPKRTPELTEEIIKQYREERMQMMGSSQDKISPYSVDILRGQAQIRYPNESEWKDVKVGEKIPQGSTIFTGMDSTTILTIKGVGVVEIAPFTEVKIDQSGIEQATANKTIFTDIELKKGEIEVNVESGVFTAPILNVQTANATTSIRGTHFWVSYKDNQTTVGVYEGKVDVKSRNGENIEVSPNGDIPGVTVISQKLSPVKVGIAGVVLAGVFGGIILILKRKFNPKRISNKRKK